MRAAQSVRAEICALLPAQEGACETRASSSALTLLLRMHPELTECFLAAVVVAEVVAAPAELQPSVIEPGEVPAAQDALARCILREHLRWLAGPAGRGRLLQTSYVALGG